MFIAQIIFILTRVGSLNELPKQGNATQNVLIERDKHFRVYRGFCGFTMSVTARDGI